jgi:diguanylate cyclase (GGDEF)-like protein
VLKEFAQIVVGALRVTDLCGRIGGEEFAVLLPCSIDEALIAAERVREAFANAGLVVDQTSIDTTVSIGVAGGPAGTELDVLLAAADAALYKAKRGGRNRVESASGQPSEPERRLSAISAPAATGIVRRGATMREVRV